MSEPQVRASITLDIGNFAPDSYINRSATRVFAVLNLTSAFYIASGDPTALDRLAEAATSLAGDLRAALAAEQSGGAS